MSGAAPGAIARLRLLDWHEAEPLAGPLRLRVFCEEQGVPRDIEIDEHDPLSVHAVAEDAGGAVIGTARLLPDGHVGRFAVAAACRGHHVGARLLQALLEEALRRGHRRAVLHAQVSAEGFYARYGFERTGGVFMEAGIAHATMARTLAPPG
ncbi:MAG: GNAT family N-acetyltransferase [Steroidobacteraceae bacterium]